MATLASRGALTSLLQAIDRPGPLVILPHDNPDPDALASAAAIKYLAATIARKESHIVLGGIVGRAENRAMLTYLNITLMPVSSTLRRGHRVVLVDAARAHERSLPDGIVPATS
jgi:nanoRNase/pAp phosphatase (c-di-AMP/oligoRNAs hydrolase)